MVTKQKEPEINPFIKGAREMLNQPLNAEVSHSFMTYSMSVVYSRALVDIRDGLKPVQRRILYTMFSEGFTPEKNYVKSARTVGSCMAVYHPHGDSSIYDAMVRLAQPWNVYVPFVDGYGNWGDAGGSGAAASRYTEAKLTKEALLLLGELREDTVDMRPNYDGESEEPVILPAQFPVALVNGTTGIAVGFASNMAPHNPTEVMDAARWLLTHPTATLERLMDFLPGPDFPTGGQILGMDQVKEAYLNGRGTIKTRAKATIENTGRGKHQIVFTEMPYGVKTENVLTKIKSLLKEGRLQGLADAKDLTDRRNGTRFVIETKAGVNADVLLLDLYKLTPLEESFGINNVVLVDGNPRTLGVKEMLEIFIGERLKIVTRRSQNRRDKRAARLHLVEGLLKALADIDKVIAIVRGSEDTNVARDSLMKRFKIDDVQANYILELQLRRLTKFDQIALENEKKTLEEEIAELDKILNDESVLRSVVGKELDAVKKQLDRPRRSELIGGSLAEHLVAAKEAAAAATIEVADGPTLVGVYADGTLRRLDAENGKQAPLKGVRTSGKIVPLISSVATTVRGKIILVTDKGHGYRVDTLHVGDKNTKADAITQLAKGEKVIAVAPASGENLGTGIFFATAKGGVKITNPDYPMRSEDFDLMSLDAGDSIVSARWVEKAEGGDIVFVSTDSSLLRFDAAKVRPQGRTGGGVAGFNLAAGQSVLAAAFIPAEEKESAMVLDYTGMSMKISPLEIYPPKGRATGGVRSIAFLKGEDSVKFAHVGVNPVVIGADGKQVTLPPVTTKRDGSGAKTIDVPTVAGR